MTHPLFYPVSIAGSPLSIRENINTRSVLVTVKTLRIEKTETKRKKRSRRTRQCDSVGRTALLAAHRLLGWSRRWRLEKIRDWKYGIRRRAAGKKERERERDDRPRDARDNEDRRIKASWLSDELSFCQSSRAHSSVSESRVENLTFPLCSICRKSNSYYCDVTLFKEEFVSELKTFQQADAIVGQSWNVISHLISNSKNWMWFYW